jgi:endo-1,4-beta-xylanase
MMKRRQFVHMVMSGSAVISSDNIQLPPTLREIAEVRGLEFGSALSSRHLTEPDLISLVSSQCAGIVGEGEGKWASLRPNPGIYNFQPLDALATFAQNNGLRMRGHTLLWQDNLPAWLIKRLDEYPQDAETELVNHVETVVGRYRNTVSSWDVVNEILGPDGLQPGPWTAVLGVEAIGIAFQAARAAAPDCKLVINETAIEASLPLHAARRASLITLIESLLRKGVPVDGLGIQAHLRCGEDIDQKVIRTFVGDIAALGLQVIVSELDVNDADVSGTIAHRDRIAADHARRFLDSVLDEIAVKSVYCWGLSDRNTWLHYHPAGWRADGTLVRPLPFDAELKPKLLGTALAQAFKGAPFRL